MMVKSRAPAIAFAVGFIAAHSVAADAQTAQVRRGKYLATMAVAAIATRQDIFSANRIRHATSAVPRLASKSRGSAYFTGLI